MTEALSQDQVLAQLQVRGFEEGFERTTLRDFWGVLTDVGGEMRDGERGAYLVALYNFGDVEVIESTVPYTSPIGQIEVSVSTKAKAKMGYLGASVDRIINAGLSPEIPQSGAKNWESLIGKKLHMRFTPGHPIPRRNPDGTWDDVLTNCWEVIEIAGEAAPALVPAPAPTPASPGPKPGEPPVPPAPAAPVISASQQALILLNGKNDQQWHQAVFVDPIVKADAGIVKSIIDKQFLAPMIEAGIVTKDETTGIYTVDMTKIPA